MCVCMCVYVYVCVIVILIIMVYLNTCIYKTYHKSVYTVYN